MRKNSQYPFPKLIFSFSCLVLIQLGLMAQKPPKWDVNTPTGPVSEVTFTTTEGTWNNLDISPDGKEIVFDLLGDIYTMPITGGKAKCISSGLAWEAQPRYSPDGKKISFTSDRAGGDNIWYCNPDGSDAKQITKEDFRLVNNAVWDPSGEYIICKKHFTGTRSLGAGEMWLYHVQGGGSGVQLTKRKDDQLDVGEPCISPDGRYVFFSEDMSGGPIFQYNKNPHEQIYMIRRYDRIKGDIDNIVTGPGGAVRPQISPDGKILAFVRRVRLKTVLYLQDLQTGEEWPLYDGLHKDQQETWATFGVYPNYAWTPDGKNIVINAKGHFQKIEVATGKATQIPFEAEVKQQIQEALNFSQEVCPETFTVKMIRHTTTSPDGKWIAFNAVGKIWAKKLPNGKPFRLTNSTENEFEPSFSPDGSKIVYTTWSDDKTGAIREIKFGGKAPGDGGKSAGTGAEVAITPEKGFYFEPRYAPDGNKIVYRKGGGNSVLGLANGKNTGIFVYDPSGRLATVIRDATAGKADSPVLTDGKTFKISEGGNSARFSSDGNRIYFQSYAGGEKVLKSIDLSGNDEKTIASSKYATDFVPSPDGKWLAFKELYHLYITPFPQTGTTLSLSKDQKAIPIYKVTRDAGDYVHWSGDSKNLHWSIGPDYYSRDLKNCFLFVPGAADSLPPIDSTGIAIGLSLPHDVPKGQLALTGARIITMKGDQVIENGTILIENNRIKAIGTQAEVPIPSGTKQIDLAGKTIMPGIVDVHAHMGVNWEGISPQQQWSYFANLAYGVTTTHDPSSNTEMVFSQSEMQKAGLMLAPRIYSTGTILYGADGDFKAVINSLDDARSHLRRMKAVGAFSVKSYNQPRREQRQQVITAARELNMMVYPEGGSFFYHNMSMILDGHTGVEHSIPVSPLYSDVTTLWGKTQTGYTPTLIVGYGGVWGENYWYQKTRVWENKRLLNFYPRRLLDARSIRVSHTPDDDFGHIGNAQSCKKVLDAGGSVQLGAHGQLHGLGAHWELWMFVQGGFTPLEAIRSATLMGARYIGMDKDIGSLEAGKLADLIVMDKNPLENIQNSETISHVMQNGRLYNAETMNEIGNYDKKRAPFFWESNKGSDAFEWHEKTRSFDHPHCGCTH